MFFFSIIVIILRYKERRNKNLADSLLGRKDACCKYNYEELTTLELELSNMYAELEMSLDNPFSALRMFLQARGEYSAENTDMQRNNMRLQQKSYYILLKMSIYKFCNHFNFLAK